MFLVFRGIPGRKNIGMQSSNRILSSKIKFKEDWMKRGEYEDFNCDSDL
jgi:hypothetical protein